MSASNLFKLLNLLHLESPQTLLTKYGIRSLFWYFWTLKSWNLTRDSIAYHNRRGRSAPFSNG